MKPLPCRLALAALSVLAATAIPAAGDTAEPSVYERPPRIASVAGPEGSAWSGCAILLEGRTRGDPPPQVSTLCLVDGKASFDLLAPVHARSHSLAAEAGPDGSLRVLVGRPGGIDEIRVASRGSQALTVTLVEDDALEPNWLGDRPDLDGDGRKDLLQATYEGVAQWRREEDGRMTRLPGIPLPPVSRVNDERILVYGRMVVEPVPPAPERFSWPEGLPGKRLRVYRVPLAAGSQACAAWIHSESQVYARRAVFLSGDSPRLVALVAPSDKFALFGNLSLLVAPLACDETARGSKPTLSVATEFDSNIGWAELGVRDVTGDGLADITIAGRQGLANEKLEVAVYAAQADGSFASRPATGSRSDLDPLGAIWDKDADGDGRLDLVVLDRTRVLLARGIEVDGPRDFPFALKKAVFASLPRSLAPEKLLHLIDFDGDGRLEALVAGQEREDDEKKGGLQVNFGDGVATEKDVRLAIATFPPSPR